MFTSESLDNEKAAIGSTDHFACRFAGILEADDGFGHSSEPSGNSNPNSIRAEQLNWCDRADATNECGARCSLNASDSSLADSSDECFVLSDSSSDKSDKSSDKPSTRSSISSSTRSSTPPSTRSPPSTVPSSDSPSSDLQSSESHSSLASRQPSSDDRSSSRKPTDAFPMSSTADSVVKANHPIITINDENHSNNHPNNSNHLDNSTHHKAAGEADDSNKTIQIKNVTAKLEEIKTASHSSWLLRLFESKLFNASLAIVYLYKSKEPGVLSYIGNKLFTFDKHEVDFFLPQLVTLYINNPDVCFAIRPYFLSRCKESQQFSLHLLWLLNSFCYDAKNCHPLIKKKCAGIKLKQSILSEELWCEENRHSQPRSASVNTTRISELNCTKLLELDSNLNTAGSNGGNLNTDRPNTGGPNGASSNGPIPNNAASHYLTVKKTHQRSYSETTNVINANPPLQIGQLQSGHSSSQSLHQLLNTGHTHSVLSRPTHRIGDLQSGQAFCNQCICLNQFQSICNELKGEKFKCTCGAPRLLPENEFVRCLINIGKGLQSLTSSKELRMQRLVAELQLLNLNLPAKVYSPLHDHINHLVVRIPPQAAVLLNSKDKAPFLIFIEILKIDGDISTATLPTKTSNSLRHTRSEENLLNCHQQLRYNRTSNCLVGNSSTCKLDSLEANYPLKSAEITINASEIRKRLTAIKPLTPLESEDLEHSSAAVLGERKIKQIREQSPFGHLANWSLVSMIVKTGDDLRQEMMCYQLLQTFKNIWELEKIPLYIRPYKIIVWSAEGGLIEPILNTVSLSQIKSKTQLRLLEYFIQEFGPLTSEGFLTAQRRFVQSCAAYSLVSYLIQLKDRHNGNILLDSSGAIIHIDFQFILSTSPRNLGFENSPFKLTDEIIEVMGGLEGDMFKYFKILILQGILACRKHHEKLISLVEILQSNTQLPCFKYGPSVIKSLTERFHMKLTEEQLQQHIEQMVENSINSITTRLYDSFQYYTNNIL